MSHKVRASAGQATLGLCTRLASRENSLLSSSLPQPSHFVLASPASTAVPHHEPPQRSQRAFGTDEGPVGSCVACGSYGRTLPQRLLAMEEPDQARHAEGARFPSPGTTVAGSLPPSRVLPRPQPRPRHASTRHVAVAGSGAVSVAGRARRRPVTDGHFAPPRGTVPLADAATVFGQAHTCGSITSWSQTADRARWRHKLGKEPANVPVVIAGSSNNVVENDGLLRDVCFTVAGRGLHQQLPLGSISHH